MPEREAHLRSGEEFDRAPLLYGAVPLDHWSAKYPGTDKKYLLGAVDAANYALRRGLSYAYHTGLFGDIDSPAALEATQRRAKAAYAFVEPVLANFETQRVWSNSDKESQFTQAEREGSPWIRKAFEGTASPDDLLRLLQLKPELGSLELAKLTHPFDREAARAMHDAVAGAIYGAGGEIMQGTDVVYKPVVTNSDSSFPAQILMRKQAVGKVHTRGIVIMERQLLLVAERPDDEDHDEVRRLQRLILNKERFRDCAYQVEDMLRNPAKFMRSDWVQPLATSDYALSPDAHRNAQADMESDERIVIPDSHYRTAR